MFESEAFHMHEEQRQRAHDYLRAQGIERALFASPASVTWLTGFAPPVQLGANPFAGGAGAGLVCWRRVEPDCAR